MKNGKYTLILAPLDYPGKKYRDKYCYEHTFVYWKSTGNIPQSGYEIHHIDGNHRNNEIKNLLLVTNQEHRKLHGALKRVKPIKMICQICGSEKEIRKKDYIYRKRHNKRGVFCTKECADKANTIYANEHKKIKEKPCLTCKKLFDFKFKKKQLYCSKDCYYKSYNVAQCRN